MSRKERCRITCSILIRFFAVHGQFSCVVLNYIPCVLTVVNCIVVASKPKSLNKLVPIIAWQSTLLRCTKIIVMYVLLSKYRIIVQVGLPVADAISNW